MKRRADSERAPIPDWVLDDFAGRWLEDAAGWEAHRERVERWRVENGYGKLEILLAQRDADNRR